MFQENIINFEVGILQKKIIKKIYSLQENRLGDYV